MIDSRGPEKRLDFCNDKHLNQKRQIRLKTCADVYAHWSSYKRTYKKAPKDGVEFQIDYIDTGLALDEEQRSKAPIALALHGAPGSYHDFSLLINHLTKQKVRVIAPNFPEYVATVKTKVLFRHSADEKAAYLRDFLKAIQVKKIDLLVSHSSAIFPTLLILLNANNEAIARQRQEQQHRKESDVVQRDAGSKKDKKTRGKRIDSCVNVESFSEIGNHLKGNVVELVDKEAPLKEAQGDKQQLPAEHAGSQIGQLEGTEAKEYDEDEDTFEDAIDEIDDNNNQCQISAPEEQTIDGSDELGGKLIEQSLQLQTAESAIEDKHANQLSLKDDAMKEPASSEGEVKSSRRHKRRQLDVIVKFDEPIEIKAVALFNPAGHRLPKSMKPTWFKCGSCHVYQHKLGRSLFRKFGPPFLTVIGVPVRVDNMDNVMLSATVMRNSKCQRVVSQLEQLSQMKIPTLLVFSENDKLIEKEIFYEMTQFMRLDSKNFDVFNNDGDIELSQSLMEDWIRVMVFKAGGHYAYSNYANTVNKAVSELLRKVTSTKNNN